MSRMSPPGRLARRTVGTRGVPVRARARLTLLGTFELRCAGRPLSLPMSAQRVLAFVALHPRPLLRPYVAGTLWSESSEERAHASLRSALWRLHRVGWPLVESAGPQLRLAAWIDVDLRDAEALARRAHDAGDGAVLDADPSPLLGDVLPDWYDDWVLLERERFRQVRLHALDALCERLTCAGRLGEAFRVGLDALAGEPLRESAHRALIRVHLAEGNAAEAVRQYRLCRRLLEEQLGIEPSAQLQALLREVARASLVA